MKVFRTAIKYYRSDWKEGPEPGVVRCYLAKRNLYSFILIEGEKTSPTPNS